MIHLDTHVALWLYAKVEHVRIPAQLRTRLEHDVVAISPMVRLELRLLAEVGRFDDDPDRLIGDLGRAMDLRIDQTPFSVVVAAADHLSFTRDPFDRLIAAQALAAGAALATKDRRLLEHVDVAVWE